MRIPNVNSWRHNRLLIAVSFVCNTRKCLILLRYIKGLGKKFTPPTDRRNILEPLKGAVIEAGRNPSWKYHSTEAMCGHFWFQVYLQVL